MEEYNKRRENYVWVTVLQSSWPSKQRNRQPNLKHVNKHQRETRTSKAKLKTSSVSKWFCRSTVCGPEAGISGPRTEDVPTPSWPSWWAGSLSQGGESVPARGPQVETVCWKMSIPLFPPWHWQSRCLSDTHRGKWIPGWRKPESLTSTP